MKAVSILCALEVAILMAKVHGQPTLVDFNIAYQANPLPQILVFNSQSPINFLVKESSDLIIWQPHFNLFMRVGSAEIADTSLRSVALADLLFLKIEGGAQSPAEMRIQWQGRNIKRYRFTEGFRCDLCQPPYAATVTVENGVVTNVENPVNEDGTPAPNADLTGFKSIEDLFGKLDRYVGSGDYLLDALAVRFDPMFSYPAWIWLDAYTEYHASNLEILE
ncbi:MAG TPA: DUF6174 domain-containing protein [Verrucomicrobiae bacterium]